MDPATAFQLAVGVVQLIDTGIAIGRAFREIYKSNSSLTRHYERLENEILLLNTVNSNLVAEMSSKSAGGDILDHDEQLLMNMAKESQGDAQQLADYLDGLKSPGRLRKRDVPGQFFKLRRAREAIEDIDRHLRGRKDIMDTQLLTALCRKMNSNDTRQREIILQLDITQMKGLRCYQELEEQLRKLTTQGNEHTTKEMKETRSLMRTIDLDGKSRSGIDKVLSSLSFPSMYARQEAIHDVYPDTYQWIYDSTNEALRPWSNFVEWLKAGNEIYWINGKAGSGKSTLMNFMVQEQQLWPLLEEWAAGRTIATPQFFFWRAGSHEQKSINGLLRSVLHQLINNYPKLALSVPQVGGNIPTWTDKRLVKTLNSIIEQELEAKVCLFIDGLEEFEGDEDSRDALICIVKDLTKNPSIKAVLSSRPEPFLAESFSLYPGLRLQDLTRRDIGTYVRGRLQGIEHMKKLEMRDADRVEQLMSKLCDKADGVFLWARLAVQDIISGLRSRDSLDMLEQRLQRLNNSLDGLFTQLVERIHPIHKINAAKCLQYVSHRVSENLSPQRTSVLHVAFALQEEFCSNMKVLFHSDTLSEDRIDLCKETLENLEISTVSQTAGLLEVQTHRDTPNLSDGQVCEGTLPCKPLAATKMEYSEAQLSALCYHYNHHTSIGFIHRTAFEFLQENNVARELMSHAASFGGRVDEIVACTFEKATQCMLLFARDYATSAVPVTPYLSCIKPGSKSREDLVDMELGSLFEALKKTSQWSHEAHRKNRYSVMKEEVAASARRICNSAKDDMIDQVGQELLLVQQSANQSITFADLLGKAENDHLLFLFLIRYSTLALVWENLSNEYYESYPHLSWLALDVFHLVLTDSSKGQQEEQCDTAISCLNLVKECLSRGLDPNAVVRTGARARSLTVWEHYLGKMHFASCTQYGHHDTRRELVHTFLSLAEIFVDHGADLDAHASYVQEIPHADDFSKSWSVLMESSTLELLHVFCLIKGADGGVVIQKLREKGAARYSWISAVGYSDFADTQQPIPTVFLGRQPPSYCPGLTPRQYEVKIYPCQERRLSEAIQLFLSQEINVHVYDKDQKTDLGAVQYDANDELASLFSEIWDQNSQNIVHPPSTDHTTSIR